MYRSSCILWGQRRSCFSPPVYESNLGTVIGDNLSNTQLYPRTRRICGRIMGEWGVMGIQVAHGRPLKRESGRMFVQRTARILTIFYINPWPWEGWRSMSVRWVGNPVFVLLEVPSGRMWRLPAAHGCSIVAKGQVWSSQSFYCYREHFWGLIIARILRGSLWMVARRRGRMKEGQRSRSKDVKLATFQI